MVNGGAMLEVYEVKAHNGDIIEKVTYDTETMLIEYIKVWSESAQDFRHISVWQFKADQPNDFDQLEKKIEKYEAERLLDAADRANEFRFFDLTGDR